MTFSSLLLFKVIISTLGWRLALYRSIVRTSEMLSVWITLPKGTPAVKSSASM
ncbi:hypothetical protein D3C73_1432750 [compost metagenome]